MENKRTIREYGNKEELPFKIIKIFYERASLEVEIDILSINRVYDMSATLAKDVKGEYFVCLICVSSCHEYRLDIDKSIAEKQFYDLNGERKFGDEEVIFVGGDVCSDRKHAIKQRDRLSGFGFDKNYQEQFISSAKIYKWVPKIPIYQIYESNLLAYEKVKNIYRLEEEFKVDYLIYTIEEEDQFKGQYHVCLRVGVGVVDGDYYIMCDPEYVHETKDVDAYCHTVDSTIVHYHPFKNIELARSKLDEIVKYKKMINKVFWTELPPEGWPFSVKIKQFLPVDSI
ncbi:MAG: hypothetical protein COA46_11415 [Porticoccaceae bacterium]|nr:MAG: hypothetical protein COA46_11415 [Porticoccaceae bacterium]